MNKATEAFEAWWADTGEQSLYALNTTTDDDIKTIAGIAWEAAIREALAEPVNQEPVAYLCDGARYKIMGEDRSGFGRILGLPESLAGQWVALVDATDGKHLRAEPVRTKDLTDIEYLQDAVTKALKKAFHLGQTYWQQADSESYAANKKAAVTQELFFKLKDDTRAVIAKFKEKNK